VVSGEAIFGEVADRAAIIIDDLISSGTTLARAAEACHARGAKRIYAAASHGVFVGAASQILAQPALEQVVITDTIPPFRLDPEVVRSKLVLSMRQRSLPKRSDSCIQAAQWSTSSRAKAARYVGGLKARRGSADRASRRRPPP
jgi:hypothetical protein